MENKNNKLGTKGIIWDRKNTIEQVSANRPLPLMTEFNIYGLESEIVAYGTPNVTLYDPFPLIAAVTKDVTNKKLIRNYLRRKINPAYLYRVYIDSDDGAIEKTLLDDKGVIDLLMKIDTVKAEMCRDSFINIIDEYRIKNGWSLKQLISNVINLEYIDEYRKIPSSTRVITSNENIIGRYITDVILDKDDKILIGDESDLQERLNGARKVNKVYYYFNITDGVMINIISHLFHTTEQEVRNELLQVLDLHQINDDKSLRRFIDGDTNHDNIFITEELLDILVTRCNNINSGVTFEEVIRALAKEYRLEDFEIEELVTSCVRLQKFKYKYDTSFFDEYQENK